MNKSGLFGFFWWFSFDPYYYLILGGTNNVLLCSVTKDFVLSVESDNSKNTSAV